MPIRAVVFDLFDTLVDIRYEDLPRVEHEGHWLPPSAGALHAAVCERTAIPYEAFAGALLEVDRELRETRTRAGLETPSRERFAVLLERVGVADPDLPDTLTALHMGMLRETVSVPAHHAELLASLRPRVRIGVASNFTHSETALALLEESGLAAHLDAVVISDAVGYRKPRAEVFEAVLRELGAAPEECLHVGDSLSADVAGAAPLRMRTAWITRRIADPDARLGGYAGPPPDFRIRDLAELPALVLEGERP